MTNEARLLVNPEGRRGRIRRHLPRLERAAAEHGCSLVVTRSGSDIEAQAARAVNEGAERLIVAGGDGTVHLALQPLVGSSTALGILPLGSGNDLATCLGIAGDLERCLEVAFSVRAQRIDVGKIGDRYFGGIASLGLDSRVARRAARLRRVPPALIYVLALFLELGRFRCPRLTVTADGADFDGKAFFAAFANSTSYGGGMRLAPQASMDDGLLDLVVVRRISRLRLLAVFPRVFFGRHVGHPAISISRVSEVTVVAEPAQPVYGDGEPLVAGEASSVTVEIVPAALRVLAARPVGLPVDPGS